VEVIALTRSVHGSKSGFFWKSTTFFCKTQDFSASSQICWKGPFRPDTTRPEQGMLPWPSTCVLRRTTRRRDLVTLNCTMTDTDTLKIRYRFKSNFKRRLFSWWPLTGRPARNEIVTLGDGPSRLVLRILIAVARAVCNACWYWGDLLRGLPPSA
jgi:hypothetical protein